MLVLGLWFDTLLFSSQPYQRGHQLGVLRGQLQRFGTQRSDAVDDAKKASMPTVDSVEKGIAICGYTPTPADLIRTADLQARARTSEDPNRRR